MNLPILTFDEPTMTAITALTAALTASAEITAKQAAIQERLLAGAEAAVAKIDGAKAGTTTRGRPRKDVVDPPVNPELAKEYVESSVGAAAKQFLPAIPTDEASIKSYVGAWTGAVEGDARAARVALLKAIATHFGVAPNFAALASLDDEKRKQIVFYIERDRAGAKVDFSAEYDFDGDPAQGGSTPVAADESDFG